MRLDKFLGDHNIGTRKQIKEYVKNGRCKVNGLVVTKSDTHINENVDEISFDEIPLTYSKFHYFMLYKPQGVVSATTDGKNKTVLDLLKDENEEERQNATDAISRLLMDAKGKPVELSFFDDEADIDLYNTPCRIIDFEGNWMKVEAKTKKGTIEKLIPVSSVLSLTVKEED